MKLALFGFVFWEPEGDFIFIILCEIKGCVHFVVSEIGFVLHSPQLDGATVKLNRRYMVDTFRAVLRVLAAPGGT